jgi:hypothetical protein
MDTVIYGRLVKDQALKTKKARQLIGIIKKRSCHISGYVECKIER